MAEPTYIFKNGHVYTIEDGKVTAKVAEADFAPDDEGFVDPAQGAGGVQMPDPPADIQDDLADAATCPTCQTPSSPEDQFCSQCGEPLAQGVGDDLGGVPGADLYGQEPPVGAQQLAKVVTPNGLEGTVMGRHDLWGDTVTVRFANGVIKHLPVSAVTAQKEADEETNPVKCLKIALTTQDISLVEGGADVDTLMARAKTLEAIKREAGSSIQGASDADAHEYATIALNADLELKEINEALAHIGNEQEQTSQAFASIEDLPAVQQASMGGTDATWLDKTLNEMKASVEATNFRKLMDEGPEIFIAGLDDAQLADAGTVRHMASRWIRSHTAGADEELRDKYDRAWLARVETQRRQRLSARKEEVRKEASTQESYDGPDDALFL